MIPLNGGRDCTICTSPRVADIDAALTSTKPMTQIAKEFSVGRGALIRHKANHLGRDVRIAQVHRIRESAPSLDRGLNALQRLDYLDRRVMEILDGATDSGTALRAIREARGVLELKAKLTGELAETGGNTTINFVHNDISLIVQVLDGYPDARSAVIEALTRRIEAG